ncbi:MAG: 2-C-methyl-D-erythritol 2,4-cyclodiphosphate synthase [bacterium]
MATEKRVRVGIGFDVHPLSPSRKFYVGGVLITEHFGPVGHSDGDPVAHSIADALLGACGMKDIGTLFPAGDEKYRDLPGPRLLQMTSEKLREAGWEIENIDAVLWLEEPRIAHLVDEIEKSIADSLDIDIDQISLKAKAGEGLGFVGEKEGVASLATALLTRPKQKKDKKPSDPVKIFTDGGSRGNPGPAACAAVFVVHDEVKYIFGERLPTSTNNQAEYQGLLLALTEALKKSIKKAVICSDSELLIKQMKGEYEIKDEHLKSAARDAQEMIEEFEYVELKAIRREENKLADKLVNAILDS